MKYLIFWTFLGLNSLLFGQTIIMQMDLPKNPVPGKCYARCVIPSEYKVVPENKILPDKLMYDTLYEIAEIPVKYDTITTEITLTESYEYEEWLMGDSVPFVGEFDEKSQEKRTWFPPKYDIIKERKLLAEEGIYWQGCEKKIVAAFVPTEVFPYYCKTFPAQYANILRRKCLIPPRQVIEKNGKKIVVDYPKSNPYCQKIIVPAHTQKVYRLETQSPIKMTCIKTVRIIHTNSGLFLIRSESISDWREISWLDNTSSSLPKIREVQVSLQQKGYYKGEINGVLEQETRTALFQFQQDNHLKQGRLDNETMKALGVVK